MTTLIIAPHCDDEAISCGGLIQARVAAGEHVRVMTIYGRVYGYGHETVAESAPDEHADFASAKKILRFDGHEHLNLLEGEPAQVGYYEVLEAVEQALKYVAPDEVVIPSGTDLNQDHRHLHHVLGIACRPMNLGRVVRVLEFFALDGRLRQPTYYVPITEEQARVKLAAIAAYRREARGGTSPRAPDNVMAQMRVWGAACGVPLAEAYRIGFMREPGEWADAGRNNGELGLHRD